ncbi:MAG: siderophore-interacting protein, partial [Actinomycetes bacterium]
MTLAAPRVPAYRPFAAAVVRVRRLGPSFLRITFTGPAFADLAPNGWDQRIKVLLPVAGRGLQDCPVGDDWYAEWRALPEARRNPMRTYTVRAARPDLREIDVDFVLHGATGPASAWAERTTAGDEVVLVGPNARFPGPTGGFEWRPPPAATRLLLAGDETAVPAICSIV